MTSEEIGKPLALVLGATGGIGGAMATKLHERGWRVRALNRNPGPPGMDRRLEWVRGDSMRPGDVTAAAAGASLVVHGVNPPGYRDWDKLAMPMLESTLAAARASGARILFPGNIYNFGPDAFPLLAEDSPQHPQTRKGRVRVDMEKRLERASEKGVPVLIVRAGDFFGPCAPSSWFSQAMVRPGRPVTAVTLPGSAGAGHAWAYLPDVAETMMRLVEAAGQLPAFARFHMEGHWDGDGTGLLESIRRVTGRPVRARRLPWWALRLAAPFHQMSRELLEMRYAWRQPIRLDNSRLRAFLGEEPHTPLDIAMRVTLADCGAL